jgi:hypothetical protein
LNAFCDIILTSCVINYICTPANSHPCDDISSFACAVLATEWALRSERDVSYTTRLEAGMAGSVGIATGCELGDRRGEEELRLLGCYAVWLL